jgi:hypothetical protein
MQETVDPVGFCDELLNFNFSVTIADPLQEDCPLIACSKGFMELTGYNLPEIVGRNCKFLLNGVPEDIIDSEAQFKCRDYVNNNARQSFEPCETNLPNFIKQCLGGLPRGEFVCVQTNATKSGDLFKNMVFLKQVELDGKPFILGLQAKLPQEWETSTDTAELERLCQRAFAQLSRNLFAVEMSLSSSFWYTATMSRLNGATLSSFDEYCVPCAGIE